MVKLVVSYWLDLKSSSIAQLATDSSLFGQSPTEVVKQMPV